MGYELAGWFRSDTSLGIGDRCTALLRVCPGLGVSDINKIWNLDCLGEVNKVQRHPPSCPYRVFMILTDLEIRRTRSSQI